MDYISLLTAIIGTVIGAIVGGLITWLITRYNLNRQFQEQNKRIELQERKAELVAINSIEKEIQYNTYQLEGLMKLMKDRKKTFINFNAINSNASLKMNKWEKHSDIIEMMDDFPDLSKTQAYYINLSLEITTQTVSIERTEKLISNGAELQVRLKEYIKLVKETGL